jgi:tripartite motif-containing protein 9/67
LDELEDLLRFRRRQLLEFVEDERERRKAKLRDQIGQTAAQLGKGRSLIQFCIEILKEQEPIAYLQVD